MIRQCHDNQCEILQLQSVTVIPTTKTGYKVKIVVLSPWPLHKRSFQRRRVNKGQFQISFHRNLLAI